MKYLNTFEYSLKNMVTIMPEMTDYLTFEIMGLLMHTLMINLCRKCLFHHITILTD